jgi:hypothetical protein
VTKEAIVFGATEEGAKAMTINVPAIVERIKEIVEEGNTIIERMEETKRQALELMTVDWFDDAVCLGQLAAEAKQKLGNKAFAKFVEARRWKVGRTQLYKFMKWAKDADAHRAKLEVMTKKVMAEAVHRAGQPSPRISQRQLEQDPSLDANKIMALVADARVTTETAATRFHKSLADVIAAGKEFLAENEEPDDALREQINEAQELLDSFLTPAPEMKVVNQ